MPGVWRGTGNSAHRATKMNQAASQPALGKAESKGGVTGSVPKNATRETVSKRFGGQDGELGGGAGGGVSGDGAAGRLMSLLQSTSSPCTRQVWPACCSLRVSWGWRGEDPSLLSASWLPGPLRVLPDLAEPASLHPGLGAPMSGLKS